MKGIGIITFDIVCKGEKCGGRKGLNYFEDRSRKLPSSAYQMWSECQVYSTYVYTLRAMYKWNHHVIFLHKNLTSLKFRTSGFRLRYKEKASTCQQVRFLSTDYKLRRGITSRAKLIHLSFTHGTHLWPCFPSPSPFINIPCPDPIIDLIVFKSIPNFFQF